LDKTKSFLWMLLGALVVLSLSDFVITRSIIFQVGNGGEANPLLKLAIDRFGVNFIAYFKIATLALMAGCIYFGRPFVYNRIRIALIALNAGAIAIVCYGFFCLLSI